jgi:hypothetical protein
VLVNAIHPGFELGLLKKHRSDDGRGTGRNEHDRRDHPPL